MPVVIISGATNTDKSFVLWNNVLNQGTLTSSGTDPSYPAVNLRDPATYNEWRGSGTLGYVQVQPPSLRNINTLGIAAHDLATTAGQISFQYSQDGTNWSSVFPAYAPATNEDLLFMFPTVGATYFRLVVIGGPSGIGVVSFGARVTFPHTPIDSYTPLHHAVRYDKLFTDSLRGQFLGNRVMAAGASTDVDFGFVQRSFVDTTLVPFEDHYNRGGTFFYAGYPSGQPRDMGYCRASGETDIVAIEYIEGANLASLSFGVESYVGS